MATDFFSNKARAAAAADKIQSNVGTSSKAAPAKPDNTRLQPWVEKYRPKSLDEVAAQDHTVDILRRTLQSANLPHMLFYGPPGTGKTSTILALAKSLFGPTLFSSRVLELNASDERGISIVRSKIKDFARQQLTHAPSAATHPGYTDKHPCPPYKIIILDEADSMTQDAQSALRRTMETYSRITRFVLVCNYVTRIIDPVASRCSKFRFKSLESGQAGTRVREIAEKEGVRMEEGVVEALVKCSEGDLRRAITFLQSAARLVGTGGAGGRDGGVGGKVGRGRGRPKKDTTVEMDIDEDEEVEKGSEGGIVTVKTVEEIAGVIPDDVVEGLVADMQPRKKGSTYEAIAKRIEDLVADGWSAGQAVSQLYDALLNDDLIPSSQRNRIALVFSEIDKRLVDGADEHLAMLDLCCRVAGVLAGGAT
ncbi:hypothetical protein MMC10_009015 [Thelotrema lepadinum]|nr:hypothetical protein [Thelotrema lepadinum]